MLDSITARLLARAQREPDRVAVHILRSAARGSFRDEAITFGEWVHGAGTCGAAVRGEGPGAPGRVAPLVPPRALVPRRFSGGAADRRGPPPAPAAGGVRRAGGFRDPARQRRPRGGPLGRFRRPPHRR